jgi:hypothetical protein
VVETSGILLTKNLKIRPRMNAVAEFQIGRGDSREHKTRGGL